MFFCSVVHCFTVFFVVVVFFCFWQAINLGNAINVLTALKYRSRKINRWDSWAQGNRWALGNNFLSAGQ